MASICRLVNEDIHENALAETKRSAIALDSVIKPLMYGRRWLLRARQSLARKKRNAADTSLSPEQKVGFLRCVLGVSPRGWDFA